MRKIGRYAAFLIAAVLLFSGCLAEDVPNASGSTLALPASLGTIAAEAFYGDKALVDVVLPDSVKSARLTAQWEAGLKSVERGEQAPDAFMGGIEQMVSDLVAQYSAVKADTSLFQQREVIGKCPRCGSDVLEGKKNFYCSNRECQFSMWKDDRFFTSKHKELTKPMAAALLKNGRIKMKGLFSEKKGVLYDAVVVLADTGEKYVNYKIELPLRPKTKGKG